MTVGAIGGTNGLRSLSDMRTSATANTQTEMGANDFLTLLTAQLRNQDPMSPMENGEFLAQLAQMSTVRGIDDLNKTLGGVASALTNSMISEASSMLGQRALVSGSTARANDGQIAGRIYVENNNSEVTLTYSDAHSGEILHSQVMTDQYAGPVEFSWNGAPSDGREIRISASVRDANGTQDANTAVYALIEGVEVDPQSREMTLQIQDYGVFMGSEITALR